MVRKILILRHRSSKSALKQGLFWSLALFFLTISGTTITAEINESSISFNGKSFFYTFESDLEAPRDDVVTILHSFEQWHKLNDKITKSVVLSRTSKSNLKRLLNSHSVHSHSLLRPKVPLDRVSN